MLSKTSIYTRLFLCLMLSAGAHGGLVYLGLLESPVFFVTEKPVEVSFLPVVDIAPPTVEKEIQEVVEPVKKQAPNPREVAKPKPKAKPLTAKKKRAVAETPVEKSKTVEPAQEHIVEMVTEPEPEGATERAADFLDPPEAKTPATPAGAPAVAPIIVEAVPRYSGNPLPEYPYLARQRHWEGIVWLLVDVSSDGSVDDLRVEQSSGYKILDRSATRTVSRWHFEPATRAGIPVTSQVRIPVRFRLEGS